VRWLAAAAALCLLVALPPASAAGDGGIFFTAGAREPHVSELWSVREGGGDARRLRARMPVGPEGGTATLSRDGRRILCICRRDEVDSVRLDGTHLSRLGPLPRAVRYDIVTLSSTGRAFWVKASKRIVSQRPGARKQRAFRGVAARDAAIDERVVPSPDGSRIAYVAYGCLDPNCSDEDTETLLTADVDGGDRTVVYRGAGLGKEIWEVAWSADGSRLIFSDGTGEGDPKGELPVHFPRRWFVAPADGSNPQGTPVDLPDEASDPFFSPDAGRLVFAERTRSAVNLVTAAADGSDPVALLPTSCRDFRCEFGPRVFGWR
jgi:WD40-like Beta Propeller Repeat